MGILNDIMSDVAEKYGFIYMVLNKKNGKVYIGKVNEFCGEAKYGIEERFKHHMWNAFSDKNTSNHNACPYFYNAIRKHGKESFSIKALLKCSLALIDEFEIFTIEAFDSTNSEKGYNIALGGGGCSVRSVSEKSRKKLSLAHGGPEKEMNLRPHYDKNGKLLGYKTNRQKDGILYSKAFIASTNTPEENLVLAREWLRNLIAGKIENPKDNKASKLPKNIIYTRDEKTKEINGYKVVIMRNGVTRNARFNHHSLTMKQKFKKALAFKKSFLEQK